MLVEVVSEFADSFHLSQSIGIIEVPEQIVNHLIGVSADVFPGFIRKYLQVVRGVHLFEDLQVLFEIPNGFRLVPGFSGDFPLVGSQSLLGYSVRVEHFPVLL